MTESSSSPIYEPGDVVYGADPFKGSETAEAMAEPEVSLKPFVSVSTDSVIVLRARNHGL